MVAFFSPVKNRYPVGLVGHADNSVILSRGTSVVGKAQSEGRVALKQPFAIG